MPDPFPAETVTVIAPQICDDGTDGIYYLNFYSMVYKILNCVCNLIDYFFVFFFFVLDKKNKKLKKKKRLCAASIVCFFHLDFFCFLIYFHAPILLFYYFFYVMHYLILRNKTIIFIRIIDILSNKKSHLSISFHTKPFFIKIK